MNAMTARELIKPGAVAAAGFFVAGAAFSLFAVWVDNNKPVEQETFTLAETIEAMLVLGILAAVFVIAVVGAIALVTTVATRSGRRHGGFADVAD